MRQLKYLLLFGYIETSKTGDEIGFGNTITIQNSEREMTFMLVSQFESDPAQKKLSTDSPIGAAVVGKKVGDQINVPLPNGTVSYTITKVS